MNTDNFDISANVAAVKNIITVFNFRAPPTMISDRLENVTQTISRLLEGYDIRLRPNFAGKLLQK